MKPRQGARAATRLREPAGCGSRRNEARAGAMVVMNVLNLYQHVQVRDEHDHHATAVGLIFASRINWARPPRARRARERVMTAAARSHKFCRTMRLASLALGYPDDQWWRNIPLTDTAAGSLSGPPQAAMRRYLGAVGGWARGQRNGPSVDTFDLRRRCLYLTYYSFGDTRKRGMSLLQFTAAYRVAGFELAADELPDHLAMLCEFTAGPVSCMRAGCCGSARRCFTPASCSSSAGTCSAS